jgi:tripartite-type tricarboxylate transporter receptor subunit TctC
MTINRRNVLARGLAMLSAPALAPRFAAAQTYPDRPIRLVVPFPPGGAFDTVGRPWAERIKPLLGTVVIENIGGGGGSVGAAQASRARPDGYTLLLGGATITSPRPCSRTARNSIRSRIWSRSPASR